MDKATDREYIFLDTNVLVALYNRKDLLHKKAVKIFKTVSQKKNRLVISNYVLLEIYTILSQKGGKKKAIEFGKIVRNQKPFLIKQITGDLEEKTWQAFAKIKDKNLSFVDCSIIALVVSHNYQLATFDKKIIKLKEQFGFTIYTP